MRRGERESAEARRRCTLISVRGKHNGSFEMMHAMRCTVAAPAAALKPQRARTSRTGTYGRNIDDARDAVDKWEQTASSRSSPSRRLDGYQKFFPTKRPTDPRTYVRGLSLTRKEFYRSAPSRKCNSKTAKLSLIRSRTFNNKSEAPSQRERCGPASPVWGGTRGRTQHARATSAY